MKRFSSLHSHFNISTYFEMICSVCNRITVRLCVVTCCSVWIFYSCDFLKLVAVNVFVLSTVVGEVQVERWSSNNCSRVRVTHLVFSESVCHASSHIVSGTVLLYYTVIFSR